MNRDRWKLWTARGLIALVLFFNLQAALFFIYWPERYAPGFEMSGPPGVGMVRGMGILFMMWSVPCIVAVTNPVRQRISLYEAIAMQAIGLVGETLLLLTFPDGHPAVEESVERFILFDGFGLAALILAAILTRTRFRA